MCGGGGGTTTVETTAEPAVTAVSDVTKTESAAKTEAKKQRRKRGAQANMLDTGRNSLGGSNTILGTPGASASDNL